MEEKSKHEAIKEFFGTKARELVGKVMKYNWKPEKECVSFVTNYADRIIKKYIRGADKEYGFTILIVRPYSKGMDDLNMNAMNLAQGFMNWIEEQNRKKNFPDFSGCQIKSMHSMQNMPNLAGVDEEAGLATYMIQCRLIYFEKD